MKAFSYLKQGAATALRSGNWPFVVLPVGLNILLFALSITALIGFAESLINSLTAWLPSWLSWLQHLIVPIAIITITLVFSFSFTMVSNLIASPFYGVLSERVASQQGIKNCSEPGMLEVIKTIGSSLAREFHKIGYYLPRALAVWLLCLFLPLINVVVYFGFNAWMLSLQYLDYPFDNQQQSFKQVRDFSSKHKSFSFAFGGIVQLLGMVPLANLIVAPAAVCASTLYWCDQQAKPKAARA